MIFELSDCRYRGKTNLNSSRVLDSECSETTPRLPTPLQEASSELANPASPTLHLGGAGGCQQQALWDLDGEGWHKNKRCKEMAWFTALGKAGSAACHMFKACPASDSDMVGILTVCLQKRWQLSS